MAALIKKESAADVDLVEGKRGEFTVWVGDTLVAGKDAQNFPSDEDALAAVQRALSVS